MKRVIGKTGSGGSAARRIALVMCMAALSLVGKGCRDGSPEPEGSEVVPGPQFSPRSGLLLPAETRESIGLTTAEVTEQKVSAALDLQLRVYAMGDGSCVASTLVTPEEAKLLIPGQAVEVRTSESNSIPARITNVNAHLQRAAGLVEALIEIPHPPACVAVGGFFAGHVTLDAGENVVAIPRSALLQCSEGDFVYTVSGDHFVRAAVKVGAKNHKLVEIKHGLYSGDEIAVEPVMSLWLAELAAVKGGQACCVEPPKGK